MQSAFALAIEDMAVKYPRLFANFTKADLSWPLEGLNVCKEEGDPLVPTMLSQWYGEHKFDNDGKTVTVILTSGNRALVEDSVFGSSVHATERLVCAHLKRGTGGRVGSRSGHSS